MRDDVVKASMCIMLAINKECKQPGSLQSPLNELFMLNNLPTIKTGDLQIVQQVEQPALNVSDVSDEGDGAPPMPYVRVKRRGEARTEPSKSTASGGTKTRGRKKNTRQDVNDSSQS